MYNAREIEKKWQHRWQEEKIFEANCDLKKAKKFITIPYPYASGPQHIGHGRSYANGDIFTRYYRAKGFNVLLPMAFHITGTPVLAISSAIERGEKKIVDRMYDYVSLHTSNESKIKQIVDGFVDPWNVVKYFSNAIKEDFISLGMSIDWRREFTTGDPTYNKFIEWQFQKLMDKGYIEKGAYPILFCPRDNNAVGEDDIASGDELDLKINEFICIKFPYEDGFLVPATLRPETIFGATNIWVNPKGIYVWVLINGEKWIVSEEAVELLRNQGKNVEILEKFSGKFLIGKKARLIGGNRSLPILPGDFVDTSTATGVVYSVPAHAPYDYIALFDLQKNEEILEQYHLDKVAIKSIKPIVIIKSKGISDIPAKDYCEKFGVKTQLDKEKLDKATVELYKSEFYNGILNEKCGIYNKKSVNEAVNEVIQDLTNEGKVDRIYVPVTRNLRCRCGEKIIVTILEDQWFLNFNSGNWKEKAFECLEQMQIVPKKYRQNFINVFHWLEKRPCARKRGLGTKLPFDKNWIIESLSDSTIYMSFYTIIHIINRNKIDANQLIPEVFDFVFLESGDINRISQLSQIPKAILDEMRSEFTYWYPVDHRHTAIMHISNHLSFYLFHHAAIFPEKYWPKLLTLIEPVIVEGEKMGKSKGNLISLAEIREKYSTDLFRFYISHSADLGASMDWREKKIQSVSSHIEKFYRFVRENITKSKQIDLKIKDIESDYSRLILSKIVRNFINAANALKEFNLRKYLQIGFYETFNLIQEFKKNVEDKSEFMNVFHIMIPDWLKLLSLTIPHVCEELWEYAGLEGFVSNALWSDFNEKYLDQDIENEYDYITNIIEDILNIQKIAKTQNIDKIFIYTAPKWKFDVLKVITSRKGDFNLILTELKKDSNIMKNKQLIPFVKLQIKDRVWETFYQNIDEKALIKKFNNYIEKRVGKMVVLNSTHDPTNKALKANPFKPAIYIGD
jgi:leucyl-tRNA synthetase